MAKQKGKGNFVFISILLIVLVFTINTCMNSVPPLGVDGTVSITPEESYFKKNTGVAKKMCRDAIKAQLKSPSSTKFILENPMYSGNPGMEVVVNGELDSQNSFGTMIRQSYGCQFEWTGSTYQLVGAKLY